MKTVKRILLYLLLLIIFIVTGCEAKEPHSRSSRMETVSLEEMNYEEIFKENMDNGMPMKSGLYQLEEKNKDKEGWKAVMSMTVKDEKITECSYDEVDGKGNMKTTDIDYPGNTSIDEDRRPMNFIPKLSEKLIDTQDLEEIPSIQGEEKTVDKFKTYVKILINAAVEGDHSIFIIEN